MSSLKNADQAYFDGRKDEALDARIEAFGAIRRAAFEARYWDQDDDKHRAHIIRFAIRRAIKSEKP